MIDTTEKVCDELMKMLLDPDKPLPDAILVIVRHGNTRRILWSMQRPEMLDSARLVADTFASPSPGPEERIH